MNNVNEKLQINLNERLGQVRYGIEIHAEAMNYVAKAYDAHLEGKTEVVMPINPVSIRADVLNVHHDRMERYYHSKHLVTAWQNNLGHAIHVQTDGTIVMYSLAKQLVKKYPDIDALPDDVASKFAMFKVLEQGEAYSHLGAKFDHGFFYITE